MFSVSFMLADEGTQIQKVSNAMLVVRETHFPILKRYTEGTQGTQEQYMYLPDRLFLCFLQKITKKWSSLRRSNIKNELL